MDTLLVRLRAHDPRRGHVLRCFAFRGVRFYAHLGWYRVTPEVADHLRLALQHADDPHSPRAFDVCTVEEAERIDAEENARAHAATATAPLGTAPRASTPAPVVVTPTPASVAGIAAHAADSPRRAKKD
jgi:hypothetical protein